jgi:hypothetical protein
LRAQIARITGRGGDRPANQDDPSGRPDPGRRDAPRVHPPSPRDFIERRMRELDRKRDDDEGSGRE